MIGGLEVSRWQLFGPRLRRLSGPRIDQVERKAGENRAREPTAFKRFLGACACGRASRAPVVECLHAQRNAVDAGGAKPRKRSASTPVGLASSVTSTSAQSSSAAAMPVEDRTDRPRAPSATVCPAEEDRW